MKNANLHIKLFRMRFICLLILYFIGLASYAISKADTIYIRDTVYFSNIEGNQLKYQENYLKFYEALLDQKQKHYDSNLSTLNWVVTIFGIMISIFVVLGYIRSRNQIKELQKEHKDTLEDHKNLIVSDLNNKIDEIIKEKLVRSYAEDLKDLIEKNANLDRVVREISESYVLRYDKSKPEIDPIVNPLSNAKDPFSKLKK
jgi:methyl-accepting chemotaxis protein